MVAKSAASERGRYRAAARDYAHAYNAKHPNGWRMSTRGSFPNLHMRRKHPGWLREWRPQRESATCEARIIRRLKAARMTTDEGAGS